MSYDETLGTLERGGLLRRISGQPDLEYVFHHVLSQEAAYNSLLRVDRARLHRDVAAVIAAHDTGLLSDAAPGEATHDTAASLVHHYERAGDDANLCVWAVRAGADAHHRFASREALDFYDRALAAIERLGADAPGALARAAFLGRGQVLRTIGEPANALANFRAMLAFGERAGDAAISAVSSAISAISIEALNNINTIRIITPAATESLGDLNADIERAQVLATMNGDSSLRGRAVWNAGLRVRFSDFDRAAALFGEALAIAEADPDPQRRDLRELIATAAADLAVVRMVSGQFDQSVAHARQAVRAARTLDNGALLADTLGNLALNAYWAGDNETSRVGSDQALAISRATGNPWGLAYSTWPCIERMIDDGDFERALALTHETLPSARASGLPLFIGFYQAIASRLARLMGDIEGAILAAREAESSFLCMQAQGWTIAGLGVGAAAALLAGDNAGAGQRLARVWQTGHPPSHPFHGYRWVLTAYAEHALRTRAAAAALPFLDWYIEARERHGARRLAADGHFWRARLRTAAGDYAGASDDLAHARATFELLGVRGQLWSVDAAQSTLLKQLGDTAGAAAASERARSLLNSLASQLSDASQRAALLLNLQAEHDE